MARPDDASVCHDIDKESWGEEAAASIDQFLSRITLYPPGNIVALDEEGRIVGVGCTMAMDESDMKSWAQTCAEGTYRGVCNVYGDLLFGVNVAVRAAWQNQGVASALVVRAGEIGWLLGKRKFQLGSRIPHLHEWRSVFSPEDYVRLLRKGSQLYYQDPETGQLHRGPVLETLTKHRDGQGGPVDPREWDKADHRPVQLECFDGELEFFLRIRIGGEACRIIRLIPGYFPDPDSCDYGVLIGWDHPNTRPKPQVVEEEPPDTML